MEQTELDKMRAEYARQIIAHARGEADWKEAEYYVDRLLLEWGAKAYRQGREHMAARIKKCADDWAAAVG